MRRNGIALALAVIASAVVPMLSTGCDSSADSLTNTSRSGTQATRSGSKSSSGSSGSSTSGGDDDDTTTGGGNPAAAANAKALFEALAPQLTSQCGPCHTTGAANGPIWLGTGTADDQYKTITAYQGVITADPSTSIIVVKPQHEGPALTGDLLTSVKAWLTAEAAASSPTSSTSVLITTTPVAIPTGAGSITLPAPGGQITFTASMAGDILDLKSLALVAPAATGLHATGIHIILQHSDGTFTQDDSLADSDTTAAKGASTPIGVGLVVIPKVAATDMITLQFDGLVASSGTTTTTTGGCKDVNSFQTNAAPQLTSLCTSCHNTGGSGFGSLDLSALKLATPDYTKACDQALSKVDTTNPAGSAIITAPTGKDAGHPYTTAPQSYVTALTTWINAEK